MHESPLTQNGAATNNYNRDFGHTGLDRLSSLHYATEKSAGSSGYYSSNMYSTGSPAYDHIYNDPVLQPVAGDAPTTDAASPSATPKPSSNGTALFIDQVPRIGRESHAIGPPTVVASDREHLDDSHRTRLMHKRHQNDLVYLQNSKKYLEAHWQALNKLDASSGFDECEDVASGYRAGSRRSLRLPTIMEGIDNPQHPQTHHASGKMTSNHWQDDHYDSLLDLDFDSFMLANNEELPIQQHKAKMPENKSSAQNDAFIGMPDDDNAIDPFSHNLIENNYKCRKYVNSCPEDPYQVDISIFDPQRLTHTNSTHANVTSYVDQLHLENTTYVLETIRKKLNEILVSSSENSSYKIKQSSHFKDDLNALKNDLDTYLCIIKENNEYEIKQFYTGLSQNHKLQTLQNALGNRGKTLIKNSEDNNTFVSPAVRESTITDSLSIPNESSYCERDESQFDTVYVQDGFSFGYKSKDPFRLDFSQMQSSPYDRSNSSEATSMHDGLSFSSDLSIHPGAYAHENGGGTRRAPSHPSDPSEDATAFDSDVTLRQPHQFHVQHKMARPQRNYGRMALSAPLAPNTNVPYLSYHRDKPSIWQQYYGANRLTQSIHDHRTMLSYPSSRPESDFTLDLPRAEQLRLKLKRAKQNRNRCKYITSFLSLVFFLLTVMIVSLLLSRGKRIFGSMI